MASNNDINIIVAFGCGRFNILVNIWICENVFESIIIIPVRIASRNTIGRSNQKFMRSFTKENRALMSVVYLFYFMANNNWIAGCNFLKSYTYQLVLSNKFSGTYETLPGLQIAD